MTGTEPQAWETGLMENITYVVLDVHKATVCVAIAEGGRSGEVRQIGVFREPSRASAKASGTAEQRRSWAELLLRGRPLRLWVASIAERSWT